MGVGEPSLRHEHTFAMVLPLATCLDLDDHAKANDDTLSPLARTLMVSLRTTFTFQAMSTKQKCENNNIPQLP